MVHLHSAFIAYAYCFAGFVLGAMFAWIALDSRAQHKKLAELEAKRAKK